MSDLSGKMSSLCSKMSHPGGNVFNMSGKMSSLCGECLA